MASGGDGSSGLALAILVVSVVIVLGCAGAFFLLERLFRWRTGWTALLALLGVGAGALVVVATFFETTWMPPPRVELSLPAGFEHRSVFLLEDPAHGGAIDWSGGSLPFTGYSARLDVPESGVLRVRALGPLAGRADITADGIVGAGGGPLPSDLGSGGYVVLLLSNDTPDDVPSSSEALSAYIKKREAAP